MELIEIDGPEGGTRHLSLGGAARGHQLVVGMIGFQPTGDLEIEFAVDVADPLRAAAIEATRARIYRVNPKTGNGLLCGQGDVRLAIATDRSVKLFVSAEAVVDDFEGAETPDGEGTPRAAVGGDEP